jgi:hypothetical protein
MAILNDEKVRPDGKRAIDLFIDLA